MSFHVLYDDITYTFLQNQSKIREWNDQLSAIAGSLKLFLDMESFQGATADSIKSYLADVHLPILISLGEVLNEFQSRFLLYKNGYYTEIDGDLHAELTEGTLDDLIEFLPRSEQDFIDSHAELAAVSESISDLLDDGIPTDSHVLDSYSTLLKRLRDLKENTATYETEHHGSDLSNFQELLAAVKSFINEYLNRDVSSVLSYQAGSAMATACFSTLENAILNAYTVRETLGDELAAAGESENARMAILEAEWAQQREEQGMWQWIAGAGAVIIGGVCVVATAGLATPLVVAGFAAGGSAILYGASEIIEGTQEMYYGSIGDPYTSSFNPIRDTIFFGNQGIYDAWGTVSTTAAGLLIPVGQGYAAAANAAKSAGQVVTRQAIAQSIVYEVGKDTIAGMAGYGAAQAGAWGGTALFGEDAGRWIGLGSGFLAGLLTAKGIDGLNAKYNLNGLAPLGVPNAVRVDAKLQELSKSDWDSLSQQDKLALEAAYNGAPPNNTTWYKADGVTKNYPPNDGFVVDTIKEHQMLLPGDRLGRYGTPKDSSAFFTEPGTDANRLSLPPDTDPATYIEYEVLKPIPNVTTGEIAAWGNSAGGGIQYLPSMTINDLLNLEYIAVIS